MMDTGIPAIPLPIEDEEPHWSKSEKFWDGINSVLRRCQGMEWFDRHVLDLLDLDDFEGCVQALCAFINSNIGNDDQQMIGVREPWQRFKIGITENPWPRWNMYQQEKERGIKWHHMSVVYAAPTSKSNTQFQSGRELALRQTSTGSMEKILIKQCARIPQCINHPNSGGERPSDGSPHFVYIVFEIRDVM